MDSSRFTRSFNEDDLAMALGLYIIEMNDIQDKVNQILNYVNKLGYSLENSQIREFLVVLADHLSDNIMNIGIDFNKRKGCFPRPV